MLPQNIVQHASIPMARAQVLADPARLSALRETGLLDSAAEAAFDRLTRVASLALNAPVALVSLVDVDRQFFKSCLGAGVPRQTTLDYSFCQHVVDRAEPLVVGDAATHLLVATNLAHVELGIRAYLGVPLITADGNTIGSFCVLDRQPRDWSDTHLTLMMDLAESVMTEIELRSRARQLDASELRFRSVEQAFERQHEFLTAVLDNLTDGIVACDADGNLTVFNRATREFHGLPEAQIARSEWAEHYDLYQADGTTLLTTDQIPLVRAFSGEVVDHVEMVIAPKGRKPLTMVASGRALRRTDGSLLGAVVAMHDVTDSRRIAAERDRLVEMLEGTPDFVGLATRDGKVQYLNAAARRMLGMPADAPLDTIDTRSIHPPHVLKTLEREAIPAALRCGSWSGDSVLIAADGRHVPTWQVIVAHRAEKGDVEYLSTVMRDMTIAKANEASLRAAQQQAEAANRAKSVFLSRASHELRTPLNAVIGFSGILLKNRKALLGTEELEFTRRIARNGRHLLSLVNDLLDLSKIEAERVDLELSVVSLFDLVHEVQDSLSTRASEFGLLLTADLPEVTGTGADLTIIADEQRLRQVLINLTGNAVKYTQKGAVEIRVLVDGKGTPVRIDIGDTGPGISPDELTTIFEPFVVGGAPAQGEVSTGLGLSITRALCGLLGYRLTVQSVLGAGTTFSVHLTRESVATATPDLPS